MEGYYTIEDTLEFEQVIDKSRFIGIVIPVSDTKEVESKIQWVRETYPNARHYVYAYRILEGNLEKASDDGEPQGTGGRPVLDLLQHRKVWNTLIVVVRYFGGILLGAGGLTRAYGGTARKALEGKPLVLLTPHQRYRLEIPYNLYEPVVYYLRQRIWVVSNEVFMEKVTIELDVPIEEAQLFEEWIDEFTSKQVIWVKQSEIMKKPVKQSINNNF